MKEALLAELSQSITTGSYFKREELDELLTRAPYSGLLWTIRAGMAHDTQDAGFSQILAQAAARVHSRARLRDWIEGSVQLNWDLQAVEEEEVAIPAEEMPEMELQTSGESVVEDSSAFPQELTEKSKPEALVSEESELENRTLEAESPESDSMPEILPEESKPAMGTEPVEENDLADPPPVSGFQPTAKVLPETNRFGFGFVKVKGAPKTKAAPKAEKPKETPAPFVLPAEPAPVIRKKNRNEEKLIDKFLEKAPQLGPPRIQFGQEGDAEDLSRRSVELAEEIVTENMAMIYLKQKQYAKALETFRKLQLKFPDKSDYFAALIKNLENQTS